MFSKKVLVAGTGKSGICAAALLARNGEKVLLFDENTKLNKKDVLDKLEDTNKDNIEVYIGELTDDIINQCELMVISPGIPVDAPFALKVKEKGLAVWSEIELAYHYEKGMVAAITGTNGKTTTTTLVGEIAKAYNDKTFVVGNIGIPYTKLCDTTSKDSYTVAEISSFQLETIIDFKPHVSAVLNITPDHLNRHYTFENYANCKYKIAMNQTADDYIVINYDDPEAMNYAKNISAKVVYFSRIKELDNGVFVKNGNIIVKEADKETVIIALSELKLPGEHNVENVLAAVAMTYYMGIPVDVIYGVCKEFLGVEHRIEYVKTVKGVKYYNDSKGTNPDAAIKGIKAMTSPTLLIGGGYDKKSTYDEWIEAFDNKVKALVLIGQTREMIAECARKHGFNNIVLCESLEEAVKYCYDNSVSGDCVLLSPACASWGMFDNYEQRGDLFKEYVRNLEE
ncbi:MAG: UDP-N-acetylmuramoyl-L-alanine--D-glutamate ligase [Lachnospiraceae bacterium]|nr:UDP-N-acetylmuramoyl-L-alanine--D-glutamate ligase [Lachnospiraceae bacterium]